MGTTFRPPHVTNTPLRPVISTTQVPFISSTFRPPAISSTIRSAGFEPTTFRPPFVSTTFQPPLPFVSTTFQPPPPPPPKANGGSGRPNIPIGFNKGQRLPTKQELLDHVKGLKVFPSFPTRRPKSSFGTGTGGQRTRFPPQNRPTPAGLTGGRNKKVTLQPVSKPVTKPFTPTPNPRNNQLRTATASASVLGTRHTPDADGNFPLPPIPTHAPRKPRVKSNLKLAHANRWKKGNHGNGNKAKLGRKSKNFDRSKIDFVSYEGDLAVESSTIVNLPLNTLNVKQEKYVSNHAFTPVGTTAILPEVTTASAPATTTEQPYSDNELKGKKKKQHGGGHRKQKSHQEEEHDGEEHQEVEEDAEVVEEKKVLKSVFQDSNIRTHFNPDGRKPRVKSNIKARLANSGKASKNRFRHKVSLSRVGAGRSIDFEDPPVDNNDANLITLPIEPDQIVNADDTEPVVRPDGQKPRVKSNLKLISNRHKNNSWRKGAGFRHSKKVNTDKPFVFGATTVSQQPEDEEITTVAPILRKLAQLIAKRSTTTEASTNTDEEATSSGHFFQPTVSPPVVVQEAQDQEAESSTVAVPTTREHPLLSSQVLNTRALQPTQASRQLSRQVSSSSSRSSRVKDVLRKKLLLQAKRKKLQLEKKQREQKEREEKDKEHQQEEETAEVATEAAVDAV